jgi:FkbM family methyltransferase
MYKLSNNCQIKNLDQIYQTYFGYPSKGYFVEVGAYDGDFVSNTTCLADIGWEGLYIEPIDEFYSKCLSRHENNNVTVCNVAIGLIEGEVKIYKGETLTTLNSDQVNRYKQIDWSKHINFSEDSCYQMRLDTLMEKMETPVEFDLLVVDVEGKEAEVFKTFDIDYWKPKMLIVELEDDHPSFQKYPDLIKEIKDLRLFIEEKGYSEIYKDSINTVFVRNEFKIN